MSKNDQKTLIDAFKSYPFRFLELSIDVIETDPTNFVKYLNFVMGATTHAF